jgi:hypothetical protein
MEDSITHPLEIMETEGRALRFRRPKGGKDASVVVEGCTVLDKQCKVLRYLRSHQWCAVESDSGENTMDYGVLVIFSVVACSTAGGLAQLLSRSATLGPPPFPFYDPRMLCPLRRERDTSRKNRGKRKSSTLLPV